MPGVWWPRVSQTGFEFPRRFNRPYLVLDADKVEDVLLGRVTLATLKVYAALYSHANGSWLAWPSQKTLSDLTSVGDRSVRRALNDLKEAGWLTEAGATEGGVIRWRLTAPGSGRTPPGGADINGRGAGHRCPTEREAMNVNTLTGGPPDTGGSSVATQTWSQIETVYPGPITAEARGRYFQLLRQCRDWEPGHVLQRLGVFVELHQAAYDCALPTLASVLDPRHMKLGDGYLRGLEHNAEVRKRRTR